MTDKERLTLIADALQFAGKELGKTSKFDSKFWPLRAFLMGIRSDVLGVRDQEWELGATPCSYTEDGKLNVQEYLDMGES